MANSLWIWYYPNSSIETVATYQMGYKKGPQVSYFESGKRQSEGNYEGEDRDEIWCNYTVIDTSYTQSTYKKGQLHGNYKKYDKNGSLRAYGDFKDNKTTGNWTYFDNNAKIYKTEYFQYVKTLKITCVLSMNFGYNLIYILWIHINHTINLIGIQIQYAQVW